MDVCDVCLFQQTIATRSQRRADPAEVLLTRSDTSLHWLEVHSDCGCICEELQDTSKATHVAVSGIGLRVVVVYHGVLLWTRGIFCKT